MTGNTVPTPLEEGEVPKLRFADDGSFMDKFLREGDRSKPARAAEGASEAPAAAAAPSTAAHPEGPPAPPPSAPAPAGEQQPGAPDAAPDTAAAPVAAAPTKHPAFQIKPKKSIVQVRTRTGQVIEPGAKKRKGGADKREGEEEKPFYLRELDRYRKLACDGNDASDRPLVK